MPGASVYPCTAASFLLHLPFLSRGPAHCLHWQKVTRCLAALNSRRSRWSWCENSLTMKMRTMRNNEGGCQVSQRRRKKRRMSWRRLMTSLLHQASTFGPDRLPFPSAGLRFAAFPCPQQGCSCQFLACRNHYYWWQNYCYFPCYCCNCHHLCYHCSPFLFLVSLEAQTRLPTWALKVLF